MGDPYRYYFFCMIRDRFYISLTLRVCNDHFYILPRRRNLRPVIKESLICVGGILGR